MWININRNGRLGNRLYSRAHVFAAALELNETVIDWGLRDVARFFPAIKNPYLPIYPTQAVIEKGPRSLERLIYNPKTIAVLRTLRPRKTGCMGPIWSRYWAPNDNSAETMRLDNERFREFRGDHKIIILNGFKLLCTEWVIKHADAIRSFFQPPESISTKWQFLMSAQRENFDLIVGIHLRASDFKTAQGGRYYLTPEQYAKIMRERIN